MKKSNIVSYTLNPKNPPTFTAAQRKRLDRVAAMPDSQIDYSDNPKASPDALWTRPGALVAEQNKQQVTLRLDADVLQFFKATGKRYQSRINAALREYIDKTAA
jgi:uncharacterized protein (DUF4415 family)